MFKEQYTQIYNGVKPDKNLIQTVMNEVEKKEKNRKKHFLFCKPVIAIISVFLFFGLAMPVLAANVEPIYQLMYLVSPNVAQFFMPVQKSDEDNGIKMEVVSAYIHENKAEIYITMQDLISDRIDETTDLFDSYDIRHSFDSSAHCQRVGYDKNTKKVTFLITIDISGANKIIGDKITFSVKEFLSHKKTYKDISIPIDLSTADIAENTQLVSSSGGGGVDVDFKTEITALTPTKPLNNFIVDGIDITGIGYINGKLHIQSAVKDRLNNGNYGSVYLKDNNGNKLNYSSIFYFLNQNEKHEQIDYCNYIFDIPQSEIGNYTAYGDFVTSSMNTKGNWRVTFSL